MLITLYTPIGIVYQKFEITENDIIYGDLLKYINLPKNELFDELDKSKKTLNKVFIKTIINLFTYENSEKINLDNEIICDNDEFTIVFSYEYYICKYNSVNNYYHYCKIENNIKNCNNIFKAIENEPWQIIFVENNDENYYEICKLAIQKIVNILQCIKPELINEEIFTLALNKYDYSLKYVKKELMTDEICKLAVKKNGWSLQYVKPELMTDEICKLAVKQNCWALQYVKQELMTEEICKLAVQQDGLSLRYVKEQTSEICDLAFQQNEFALQYMQEKFKKSYCDSDNSDNSDNSDEYDY